jgi:hypothetical protein
VSRFVPPVGLLSRLAQRTVRRYRPGLGWHMLIAEHFNFHLLIETIQRLITRIDGRDWLDLGNKMPVLPDESSRTTRPRHHHGHACGTDIAGLQSTCTGGVTAIARIANLVQRHRNLSPKFKTPDHKDGHIAGYDGKGWVSDFAQRRGENPYRDQSTAGPATHYRYEP